MNLYFVMASVLWVLIAALYDAKQKRMPNWLMLIGLAGVILFYRIAQPGLSRANIIIIAIVWLFSIGMFALNLWGAGDTKFLVITIAAYPKATLAITLLAALIGAQLGGWVYTRITRRSTQEEKLPLVTYFSIAWAIWMTFTLV